MNKIILLGILALYTSQIFGMQKPESVTMPELYEEIMRQTRELPVENFKLNEAQHMFKNNFFKSNSKEAFTLISKFKAALNNINPQNAYIQKLIQEIIHNLNTLRERVKEHKKLFGI